VLYYSNFPIWLLIVIAILASSGWGMTEWWSIAGVVVAVLAALVAILAWLRPKQPRTRMDRYTTRIESVQDGYDFYSFLLKHHDE
jgi:membrane protein YdbS with pleckstrin-like domain